jgi:hypothetical protein
MYRLAVSAWADLHDLPVLETMGLPGVLDELHVCLEVAKSIGQSELM